MKPGVIMATEYFKRTLLLNWYREEKNIASLFPPATEERERCLTLAACFLCLETPGLPACYSLSPWPHSEDEYFNIQRSENAGLLRKGQSQMVRKRGVSRDVGR